LDKLSPHISKYYSLIGIKPGVLIFKGEKLDFRSISKERADRAYAEGCQYLRKKRKPKED
jgi:hypothetical protein